MVKPSALQPSLPTPWCTKKRPSGSYFSLMARSVVWLLYGLVPQGVPRTAALALSRHLSDPEQAAEIVVIREWWYIGSDIAEVTMIRLWGAHERVSVKRATAEEGKR